MSLDMKVKALEDQVAELFAQNRSLVKQIQELAGASSGASPRQVFDAKMLAQRIHRDGWGVMEKPKKRRAA